MWRWVATIRQIVETVYDKLFDTFGLWRERPHEIEGLRSRLAARFALHDFCIWPNDQLVRLRPKFADLPAPLQVLEIPGYGQENVAGLLVGAARCGVPGVSSRLDHSYLHPGLFEPL
jgi:hypothetical protein